MFWQRRKTEPQANQVWTPPNKPVSYPMWTFAKTEKGFWLVLDKTRSPIISERAAWSWGKPIVKSSEAALSNYRVGRSVGFAPGSLLRSMDNQHWFITGSQPLTTERRLISTPDFFGVLGFNPANAILVSADELSFHKEGDQVSGL